MTTRPTVESAIHETLFIGGRWVKPDSDLTIEVVSPFTEEVVAKVPSGSRADIDRAVLAARTAFDQGDWAHAPLGERVDVLRRLSDLYAKNRDALAQLGTMQMGTPISLTESLQSALPRMILDSFTRLAQQYPWTEHRRSTNGQALVRRAPVGVVGAIVPWNAPQMVMMFKLVPALLAGCTVVLKPAPETPLDAYFLAEMLQEAGLPDGVVNVVPADREASESLVTHAGVDKITFTGSTAAGQRIGALCGQDLRRVSLELGGKSAAIILDDADLDTVMDAVKRGSFTNAGQACNAKTRILVSRDRQEEFANRFGAAADAIVLGDPMDRATEMGPLVTSRQRERVEGYIAQGHQEGARLVAGGRRPDTQQRGWFVEPTVFADVDPDARIAQDEIFGPVVAIIPYDDERQAVEIANNSAFGLSGSIFTSDPERALKIATRIRTGTVEINGCPPGNDAPMGGFKRSGIGRELGVEGIDSYVEYQSIGLPESLAL
ncbi:aldehyde dehydrogenase [Rhodococcus sp. DMU1]|uniref:aldehyde dehydrogenase n=1 Tax=Rhodococcus sp. DMU1 TaxID=2722825 RepID=UPI00143E0F35|nr:aldehyde dehydrogenase [Rhodococcus sp. DMU1]QIX53865.1 aldehyde dehydrogenase [Rhodococcus sp. DMU1]